MIIFQPKQRSGAKAFALLLFLGLCRWATAATPYTMTWSSEDYGPDGPWNAVQVSIGSPGQTVALYPGSIWESKIILSYLCDNTSLSSVCYADKAGVFNTERSRTWENESIQLAPDGSGWQSYTPGHTNAVPTEVIARRALDSIDIGGTVIPEVDLVGISQAYQTYPGGQEYPLQVGLLSLGAPNINHTFDRGNDTPSINGTFITSWLWEKSTIASYSYGLHIGSASLGIPGSLLLGGYDKNRVLGHVSAQPFSNGGFPIQLLDISLGVAEGGSPWSFYNRTGFLAKDNSSLETGITVQASTADPYLYLPQSSCDAIAAELPVIYQSDYGLYFWDTSDSRYSKIITSPSYMAFTFSRDGLNNADITINVPFALLNLTLRAPLIDTPTQYFPCMGTDSTYALGRAFFQAAFVGVNWNQGTGNWFLAQAPGPGYSTTPATTNIDASASTLTGSGSSWEASWARYWTELPDTSNSNSTSTSTPTTSPNEDESSSGLSTGTKAGIGVGCAVGGVLVVGLLVWRFFLRRRRQSAGDMAPYPNGSGQQTAIVSPSYPASVGNHYAKPGEVHEMAGTHYRQQEGPYELYER
ncbi:aspartic peptidase domain-containing protein [Aspergillus pseudodeflectus]|uniref:Aspartic peptidase domain-containing protein n=1 Tax=Aspergillus pseudodeflectus TaxID=176178 RepID=A0ABR4JR35_9EURO